MPKAKVVPIHVPKVEKKLTEAPAWPLFSSSTRDGAIPKAKPVPIPFEIAKAKILKSKNDPVNFKFLPSFSQ